MSRPRAPLTVVVPLHNEAANVAALGRALAVFLSEEGPVRPVDFVLVDDGSTDATGTHLEALVPTLPAQIVTHAENRGLTAALASGAAVARGALIGWLDSDLTYAPSLLAELASACDAGADMALSSCYHRDGRVEGVPGWRLLLSQTASMGHRLTSGARLRTFTSMVRVQRRDILLHCWPRRGGFVGVTEMLLRALRLGYRVTEVPAVLHRRRTGVSKMRVFRVSLAHLGLMLDNLVTRLRRRGSGSTST